MTNRPFCPTGPDPDSDLCGLELPMGLDGINIGASVKGGLPYQPWLATLVKERTATEAKDDPHVRCMPDTFLRAYSLPHLLKIVQTPGLLIMLSEVNASYRQVFTDGRPLPQDPTPSWQGYSSAKWDGDTLVIDSIGFRDGLWIDWNGSEIGEAAKVRERIRRPDYGHLEIEAHRGRSQGVHQAVDGHAHSAHRRRHRTCGRDLFGERTVGETDEVTGAVMTHSNVPPIWSPASA